jgi:two-component system response regulator FixJ
MSKSEIFVVDDDPLIRQTLSAILESKNCNVTTFGDGDALLAVVRQQMPDCIILDVKLPGRSGLAVLQELSAIGNVPPVLMISGQGDIPMAVQAMRSGALDFIEKPFKARFVRAAVREALDVGAKIGSDSGPGLECGEHLKELSPREREVLARVASGASSKEVGRILGISPRTVEVYRSRLMEKLGAKNTADLIRIALTQGVGS